MCWLLKDVQDFLVNYISRLCLDRQCLCCIIASSEFVYFCFYLGFRLVCVLFVSISFILFFVAAVCMTK